MRHSHGSGDPCHVGSLHRSRTRESEEPDTEAAQHHHGDAAEPKWYFAVVDDDFPSAEQTCQLYQAEQTKEAAGDFQSVNLWIHGVDGVNGVNGVNDA